MRVLDTTLKTAAAPLKVMLVAPVRLVPRILTGELTLPEVGKVSTKGGASADPSVPL